LSVAKGLYAATGAALVPVPTLEALANAAAAGARTEGAAMILAALDARRDDVYCQLFEREGDQVRAVWDVEDLSVEEMLRRLPARPIALTGDAAEKVARSPGGGRGGRGAELIALTAEHTRCSAAAVGRLGTAFFESGLRSDPAELEPRYVKEFFLRTKD